VETIKDEINEAATRLQLPVEKFRALPELEARKIFDTALAEFVSGGDRRWWWEAFSKPSYFLDPAGDDGFKYITQIVPDPEEVVLFIAEEDQLDFYPVYEGSAEVITQVIMECYRFEYYLIAKDMSWLLCENHHNRLIGVGETIIERLRNIDA